MIRYAGVLKTIQILKKDKGKYKFYNIFPILGLSFGTLIIIFVFSIMDGMEKVISDSFKISEYATKISIDSDEELKEIFDDFKVSGYNPILQSDRDVIISNGFNYKVCNLILKSNYNSNSQYGNFVDIGESLALNFGLFPGDSINIVSPLDFNIYTNLVPNSWFTIREVYSSPLIDIESNNVYISSSNEYSKQIQPNTYVILKSDIQDVDKIRLKDKYMDIVITDWESDNKDLFSAIRLEKLLYSSIGYIVIVVSCFNYFSNMSIMIVRRIKNFAILRALGMSKKQMHFVFRVNSFFDGLISFFISIATLIILNMSGASQIFLNYLFPPDVYFIFSPIYDYNKIFLIFVVNLFCLLIASYYPSMTISRSNIISLIKTSDK